MTQFHGFCSFPHGGWSITGLVVTSLCALAATMWSMASCRYIYIDYMTDRGDFNDFFRDPTADGEPVLQRVGSGLFTWLEPFANDNIDDAGIWTEGQCTGYSEGQRMFFSDVTFEVSRVFAILSVLMGMAVVLAIFFLSCVSLRRFQIWILSAVLGLISIFVCLTFVIFQSKLCNDLVSYQNDAYTTECAIDQGGLIAIGSSILWIVACTISVVYIKDPKRDVGIANGEITNMFEARQEQRYLREKERRIRREQRRRKNDGKIESSSSKNKNIPVESTNYRCSVNTSPKHEEGTNNPNSILEEV